MNKLLLARLGQSCTATLLVIYMGLFPPLAVTKVTLAALSGSHPSWLSQDHRDRVSVVNPEPVLGDPLGYSLGSQHVLYRGPDSHIHEIWFDGGKWKQADLTQESNAPPIIGNPYGYSLGSLHIVYQGIDHHIHEIWFDHGKWIHVDLTQAAQAPLSKGEPVGYVLNSLHVIYRGIDDHIHEIWFEGNQWKHENITEEAKAPLAVGNPSGYSLGTLHVVYRAVDHQIHEVWFDRNKWQHSNITAEAQAPLAASEPIGYVLENLHVIYRGIDHHIHELWFNTQGFSQKWRHTDLTTETKAPLAIGQPSAYSLRSLHLVYLSADGNINELWFDHSLFNSKWRYDNLTQSAKAPAAAGNPFGYVLGSQHIVYRGTDGQIHEIWYENRGFNQGWRHTNLTEASQIPVAGSN